MYADLSYGERFVVRYRSANGVPFRLALAVAEYEGPADEIRGVGSVVRRRASSVGGDASMLAPVTPTTLRIQVPTLRADVRHADGSAVSPAGLFALGGLPDGAVRVTLRADLDGDSDGYDMDPGEATAASVYEVPLFSGYALPDMVTDLPGDDLATVEITAVDGFHLTTRRAITQLLAEPDDPSVRLSFVDWIRLALAQIGPADGLLVTGVDWRPYVDGAALAATDDPAAALRVFASAMREGDEPGAASLSQDAAVRALCARLLARLFLAPVKTGPGAYGLAWHVMQRGLLAHTQGLDVPTFAYPLAGLTDEGGDVDEVPGVRTVANRIRDTITAERGEAGGGIPWGASRSRGLGHEQVESAYDFRPDLGDLILNGSFEDPGDAPDEAARWNFAGLATAEPLADSPIPTLDATNLDERYLSLGPDGIAEQKDLVSVPGSAGWDMDLSWDMATLTLGFQSGGSSTEIPFQSSYAWGEFRLSGSGTTWGLRRCRVRCARELLPGEGLEIKVDPILGLESSAVLGVPVIPVGAVLRWSRYDDDDVEVLVGQSTVTERASVGDTTISADLVLQQGSGPYASGETARLRVDDWCEIAVWWNDADERTAFPMSGGGWAVDDPLNVVHGRVQVYATGVDQTGQPVSGALWTRFECNTTVISWFVDDVRCRLTSNGQTAASSGARAMLAAGQGGALSAALPLSDRGGHAFGDGPLPTTATRMRVRGSDDVVRDTVPAWAVGVPTEDTGVGIDLLAATEALRQLAGRDSERGGPERWRGTVLLPHVDHVEDPTDALFWSADVYRLYQPCALALPAVAGASQIALTAPPKTGQPVVVGFKDGPTAPEETHYAGTVTAGAGYYVCDLVDADGDPATLAGSHAAHTECRYGMSTWPDADEWDTGAARVTLDASDLALRTGDFVTELTLSA